MLVAADSHTIKKIKEHMKKKLTCT